MNLTTEHIPRRWEAFNSKAFSNWFKNHIKSPLSLDEDYQLLKEEES